jgi:hypothetical protein
MVQVQPNRQVDWIFKSHPREWVDGSSPAYDGGDTAMPTRICQSLVQYCERRSGLTGLSGDRRAYPPTPSLGHRLGWT